MDGRRRWLDIKKLVGGTGLLVLFVLYVLLWRSLIKEAYSKFVYCSDTLLEV